MSRASIEALLERNAKACEEARYPTCVCRSGGQFHGKGHSIEWVREQAEQLEAEHRAARVDPAQLGLFPC